MSAQDISIQVAGQCLRFSSSAEVTAEVLETLAAQPVIALKDSNGFVFVKRPTGVYHGEGLSIPPGVYMALTAPSAAPAGQTTTSKVAPAATAADIFRAQACVRALKTADPVQALRAEWDVTTHDILRVVLSNQSIATLKYMVAVSPDCVTVAVDCPPLQPDFLETSVPVQYQDAFAVSNIVAYAQQLPLQTIFEICNKQDSLIEMEELFECIQFTDDLLVLPTQQPAAPGSKTSRLMNFFSKKKGATPPPTPPLRSITPPPTAAAARCVTPPRLEVQRESHDTHSLDSERSSSPAPDLKSQTQSYRRLVFTGHSFAGSIAQIMGLQAQQTARIQGIHTEINVVAFSAPFCVSISAASRIAKENRAASFLNLCSRSDAVLTAVNAALALSFANALGTKFSPAATQFLDVVSELIGSSSSSSTDPPNLSTDHTSLLQEASRALGTNPEYELYPLGMFGFADNASEFVFTDHEDGILAILRGIDWRGRNLKPMNHLASLTKCTTWMAAKPEWIHVGSQAVEDATKSLVPKLDKCHLLHSESRTDLVLTGMNLEAVRLRGEPHGARVTDRGIEFDLSLTSATSRRPLEDTDIEYLDFGAVWIERGTLQIDPQLGHVLVSRFSQTEVRLILLGVKFQQAGQVIVRTDFGESKPFKLTASKSASDAKAFQHAEIFSAIDPGVLQSAFLRGMLDAYSRPQSTSGVAGIEVLELLVDLEAILLNSRELAVLVREFQAKGIANLPLCLRQANSILAKIVGQFGKPLAIETRSTFGKFLRRFLGGIGLFVGGIFTVAAAVAGIPGLLLMAPGIYLMRNDRSLLGGLLSVPGGLAVLGSLAVGGLGYLLFTQARKMSSDSSLSLQYIQILKFFLSLVDGDPSTVFEEIPELEQAIVTSFARISGGLALTTASREQIARALETFAHDRRSRGDEHPISILRKVTAGSRAVMVTMLLAVARMTRLRSLLESHLVLSFVGVHNSGKSTCIKQLFGVDTNPSALERTEIPSLYDLVGGPDAMFPQKAATANANLRLSVIDFPGTTDERLQIASLTSRLSEATSIFICVFTAGHIAAPERQVMNLVQASGKPYLVLINKCDTLSSELERNFFSFRTNYARVLDVQEDRIVFSNMRDSGRVDAIRSMLFAHLRPFVPESLHPRLAVKLLHPSLLAQLLDQYRSQPTQLLDVTTACVAFLLNNQRLTLPRVETYLSHVIQRKRPDQTRRVSLHEATRDLSQLDARLVQPFIELGFNLEVLTIVLQCLRRQEHRSSSSSTPPSQTSRLLSGFSRALSATQADLTEPASLSIFSDLVELVVILSDIVTSQIAAGHSKEAILTCLCMAVQEDRVTVQSVASLLEERSRRSTTTLLDIQADIATFQPQQAESLLRGYEQLSLLRYGVRVASSLSPKFSTHRIRMAHTKFDPAMDTSARIAVFADAAHRHCEKFASTERLDLELEGSDIGLAFLQQLSLIPLGSAIGPLRIVHESIDAVDVGGVLRSLFTAIATGIREGKYPFFKLLDSREIYFNPLSHFSENCDRRYLRAAGRMLGLFWLNKGNNLTFPVPFALAVFKLILGDSLTLDDLEQLMPEVATSIKQVALMDESLIDDLDLTFTVTVTQTQTYPLVPNGDSIPVTQFNRSQYLEALIKFYLGANLPLRDFVQGVVEICPLELLSIFTPQMLQVLTAGSTEKISAEDLTKYLRASMTGGLTPTILGWFVQVVSEMESEEQQLLLLFVTGSSVLPIGGLERLNPPLTVRGLQDRKDCLPLSHTCFHMLDLPTYSDIATLRTMVLLAIRNVAALDFGMA
eukprot:m.757622 g.757622  ORF g.757622 m.757622 type:complete len:1791 (-) comp59025_c0_seq1:4360-9732(-)